MLKKNKRKICYISVPVAPPESISKHRLWWFEVLTLTAKQFTIFKNYSIASLIPPGLEWQSENGIKDFCDWLVWWVWWVWLFRIRILIGIWIWIGIRILIGIGIGIEISLGIGTWINFLVIFEFRDHFLVICWCLGVTFL